MGIKKIFAAVMAAMALSLTAYAANEGAGANDGKTTQAGGDSMWDILPKIDVTDESAFEYEYDSKLGGMKITNYLGESPEVRIPDTIEDKTVVAVDLSGCDKEITELIMPESVKSAEGILRDKLQYINFPAALTDHYSYGDPFFEKGNGINLYGHNTLKGVYVSEGIQWFFCATCQDLKSVYLPDSVKQIYFRECGSLTRVMIPGVSDDDKDKDIVMISGNVGKIDISDFRLCKSLKSVTILDGVTRIGNSAFEGCTSLESVTISEGVTKIGTGAFYNCTNLKSVTIPDSVTSIDRAYNNGYYQYYDAFEGCTNLTSVTYKGKTYDYAHIEDLYRAVNGR